MWLKCGLLSRLWPQAGFYLHRRDQVDIFEEEHEIWNTLLKVYFISHKEHEAPQINDHNHVYHHRNPHAHHQQCDHNIKQYPLQREIIYFLGFIRLCHYKKVHFGNINFLSQNWFHHKKIVDWDCKVFRVSSCRIDFLVTFHVCAEFTLQRHWSHQK